MAIFHRVNLYHLCSFWNTFTLFCILPFGSYLIVILRIDPYEKYVSFFTIFLREMNPNGERILSVQDWTSIRKGGEKLFPLESNRNRLLSQFDYLHYIIWFLAIQTNNVTVQMKNILFICWSCSIGYWSNHCSSWFGQVIVVFYVSGWRWTQAS